ncbi:MAG: hypothetical protein K9I94_00050 [Bacteroidales bacterium]|nr:hypothetical protein [Bacteroidales bacterium]
MKKIIIQIVLAIAIVALGYLVVDSIMTPVKFKQERMSREKRVIERLKNIRQAERTYKSINNRYTGSFDTLVDFLKTGKIPVVKVLPDPTDTTFTKTIKDTLGYVNVADSLFRTGYTIDSLRYIPFSGGEKFELSADRITKGGVEVSVVEAKAHYNTFLKGMNPQLVRNLIAGEEQIERYPGLKFGSMEEPSTDGNWE